MLVSQSRKFPPFIEPERLLNGHESPAVDLNCASQIQSTHLCFIHKHFSIFFQAVRSLSLSRRLIGASGFTSRCATSRTVPESIPGGVTWDFFRGSFRRKPCVLRSTQPLKMSTSNFSWGKGGRCIWLTTHHSCSAESREDPGP